MKGEETPLFFLWFIFIDILQKFHVEKQMIRLKNLLTEDAEEFIGIVNLPVQSFVSRFKTIASDPKEQSLIHAGVTDGKPTDEAISFSTKNIVVGDLIPTQSEIGQNESIMNILTDQYNSLDTILNGNAKFPTPIVTLNGKFIIDGHHRWSQAYAANPKSKIVAFDMKASISPLDALKAVHVAIAADTKDVPTVSKKGVNLLSSQEKTIKDFVIKYLTEQSLKLYADHGHGDTKEKVADYIWGNVKQMQSKNKPISDAPKREFMPQTDTSQKFDDLLKKGVVNFRQPKSSDVKSENRIKLIDLL